MSNTPLAGKKYFEFSDEQRLNWLRLYRSQNVGPMIFRDLISHFGTAEAALEALPDLARRGGAASKIRICPRESAEKELTAATRFGARFIALGEPGFPENLRQSEQSPPILCIKGDSKPFTKPMISIVGSRNASISGLRLTERIASQLAEREYTVVSGLARGIDTAAHKASLSRGTIAVFGGGLDCVFPEENQGLVSDILDNAGTIVAEMPMGWQPRAKDFPRRNRIVAGLSKAVLVVEAAKRSGSLITARLANEMGRIVLAVPGSPLDPRSDGANSLIRDGATLTRSADDVVEALTPIDGQQSGFVFDVREEEKEKDYSRSTMKREKRVDASDIREQLVSLLGPTPTDIDDLIHYCGAEPGTVQLILLELALAGRIQRHSGNRVSLLV